jgi:hypothetical protein
MFKVKVNAEVNVEKIWWAWHARLEGYFGWM